ncbi:MAG: hypothetical protein ACSLFN_02525 [Candidatus Limnocylindrales bacterium]
MIKRRPPGALVALLLAVLLGGCQPAVTIPLGAAPPEVVLDAYLRALVADDCDTGRRLATSTFKAGNGELCGGTDVTAYRIDGRTPPSGDEVVFSTVLTTTGDGGQSIRPGEMIWFYSLGRQPDDSWRLIGGGSGP